MARRTSPDPSGAGVSTAAATVAGRAVAKDQPERTAPLSLLRSAIYRRLPVAVRMKLDRAILLRPEGCRTLDDIAERFELTSRHGISRASLRTYARKVESLVRPEITAQVVAGVLGCLPRRYREQVANGSQVMLLSRVVGALEHKETALSVAELAKLASVLASVARRTRRSKVPSRDARRPAVSGPPLAGAANPQAPLDPSSMARAVRLLYGLSWPPPETSSDEKPA